MASRRPIWFEEPMRVDRPLAEWKTLAATSPIPLAGGENLRGAGFDLWHEAGVLRLCAGSDLSTDHLATSLYNRIATAVSKWTQTQLLDDERRALAPERRADFTPAPVSCESMRCGANG